jgi:methyl-accepting chemotaxis protein
MKIGVKLGVGFGTVVLLLIILGGVGMIELKAVDSGYKDDVLVQDHVQLLAVDAVASMLQVRRSEKDFVARQDMKYFNRGNKYIAETESVIQEIRQASVTSEIKAKCSQLVGLLTEYKQAFAKLARATEERGLNEKLGLQGIFRGAAHNVDGMMKRFDTDSVQLAMLMLRRYEKDILLNQDDDAKVSKYQGKFSMAVDDFRNSVESSNLGEKVRKKLLQTVENYSRGMAGLIAADSNGKKLLYGEVRAAAHELEALLEEHAVSGASLLYLAIRKDEKDYMLRRAEKYVRGVEMKVDQLVNMVAASQILDDDKRLAGRYLSSYKQNFISLVEKDKQITAHLKEMKASADKSMELAEDVESLALQAAKHSVEEISVSVGRAKRIMWAVGIFSVIGSMVFAFFFGRSISKPLVKTVNMIEEMEKGHLDMRLNMNRSDEIGRMAGTMDRFADSLQNEMVDALQKLADNDLTFDVEPRDEDDLIRGSLQKAGIDLNNILSQMNMAGEQVAAASGQVSDASQSLSQGATEQASSLEEIASSMNEMASQTKINADNAGQASRLSIETKEVAERGNRHMKEMVAAMGEINEAGRNISKIIKVIDEIAFQTNLLALNAAVEAARAGKHGKGFAVVAEEVRNLAARSAKAAKETAELIEGSVAKTRNGSEIATQTEEALQEIVSSITKVTDLVSEIAAASNEQAEGISQVNEGLGQIDQVTQQNTANAEQSAAAAEELSGQAAQLRMMLSRFTLKGQMAGFYPELPTQKAEQVALEYKSSANGYGPEDHLQRAANNDLSWGGPETSKEARPAADIIRLDDQEFGKYS